MKETLDGQAIQFFGDELPGILGYGKTYVKIKVVDWRGYHDLKITITDVLTYYKDEAPDMMSGCRTIAGFTGDWRPIDNIAEMCHEWFKYVNLVNYRRAAKSFGLTPKF